MRHDEYVRVHVTLLALVSSLSPAIAKSMGTIFGRMMRPFINYNVENRAHRVLDANKPVAAPKHPTTIKLAELQPQTDKMVDRKRADLDERLKQVYVTSKDERPSGTQAETFGKETTKKLPQSRAIPQMESMFGPDEPERIPEGKLTIRQTLELLCRFQSEPDKWTSEALCEEYKLDSATMENVIKYYMAFNLYVPDKNAKGMPKVFRPDPNRLMPSLVVPGLESGDGSVRKRYFDVLQPTKDRGSETNEK